MQALCVVETFEEDLQIRTQILQVAILAAADLFLLERPHEALAFGVVIGIPRPAHAFSGAVLRRRIGVRRARVLHTTTALFPKAFWERSRPHCKLQNLHRIGEGERAVGDQRFSMRSADKAAEKAIT